MRVITGLAPIVVAGEVSLGYGSVVLRCSGQVATAEVGCREVRRAERGGVEPHLPCRAVEVLPEGQRKVSLAADIDETVKRKLEFVVVQVLLKRSEVGFVLAG